MSSTHERFLEHVEAELAAAYEKHGREKWSRHEFAAILREEFEELWDAVKTDSPLTDVVAEAAQVVAVCIRFVETGDRYHREGRPDTAEALDLVVAAKVHSGPVDANQVQLGLTLGALKDLSDRVEREIAGGLHWQRDWACAECVQGAAEIPASAAGFRCGRHAALAVLAARQEAGA